MTLTFKRYAPRQGRISMIAGPFAKRFVLALLLVSILALLFWTQSRYPALDEKVMMSGAIQLEDPLSFEALLRVMPEDPLWQKIAYSTVNWVKTNRQGMIFGVLFGAAFLTLFGYMRRRSFRSGLANSFLGLSLGAPLGVCANCAAPIAKGLYSSGVRAEAALSAMMASPTLNIVVLTMLFSLFPFYMAVAKIAFSLVVILIAVPIICRFLPASQLQRTEIDPLACPLPGNSSQLENESFPQAILPFAKDYCVNLWFIVKTTVPLMFLAGFLGATVATLLPADLLHDFRFGALTIVITSIIGTFLPVPIGFDVVASGALLNGGLDAGYVMILLCTLGIFSIYSFFIIASSISFRAATLVGLTVIGLGMIAGVGADAYHKMQTRRALEILTGFDLGLITTAHANEAGVSRVISDEGSVVTVRRRPFAERSPAAELPFTRLEAWHLGIDKPVEFSFKDMWPPFWEGRSVSSGDFDNDDDIDLVLASTERGLYFYLNDGSGRFERVEFSIGRLADLPLFNAALVDIDDDGWLDLFITTYRAGNFVLGNDHGRFDAANLTSVGNRDDAVLSLAATFGDVDRDGDLDLALGNWAAGWYRRIPGEEARNRIVFNEGGILSGESFRELPGLPGETLSILLSDIDLDGALDLLVGNDFEQPDIFYLGDGKGGFAPIRRQDGIVPFTTTTTMSIKTADLHGDGIPEIYVAQIAGRSSGVSETLKMQSLKVYCSGIERAEDRATCQKNMDIKAWYKSGHSFDPDYAHKCLELDGKYQGECKGMLVKDLAIQNRDPAVCDLIPADQQLAKDYCEIHFRKIRQPTAKELAESIPQILRRNVLLVRRDDGTYEERAVEQGLGVGGWSWDVKVADLDNDEWQDVYVVNGTWVPNEVSPSNLFFRNTGHGTFEEKSGPFGLEDYLITAAATAFDLEGDGDLDLLTATVNGPVMAFVNNSSEGQAIAFEFRDRLANHFGIGTRIEIRYGEEGERRQTRELQAGGGFMSFDAPVAYFGLGEYEVIDSVTIAWTDGDTTIIDEGLLAGALYRIERKPKAKTE